MTAPGAKLLVALHDVTPAHAERLDRAERLLARLGVRHLAYLLVPNFHGVAAVQESSDFVAWCRSSRDWTVQWFLHGYFHAEDRSSSVGTRGFSDRLAARFLTAGEGEFLSLRGEALSERIAAGIDVFQHCLGFAPTGFVAPAWLYNDELLPALTKVRFQFTESHFHLFQLQQRRQRTAPVITWATRTRARRHGSLAVAMAQRRWWRTSPVVRVAIHPNDFDHPRTAVSIARTLDILRRHRIESRYDDDLFDS
jgi:predicted deacetylase